MAVQCQLKSCRGKNFKITFWILFTPSHPLKGYMTLQSSFALKFSLPTSASLALPINPLQARQLHSLGIALGAGGEPSAQAFRLPKQQCTSLYDTTLLKQWFFPKKRWVVMRKTGKTNANGFSPRLSPPLSLRSNPSTLNGASQAARTGCCAMTKAAWQKRRGLNPLVQAF